MEGISSLLCLGVLFFATVTCGTSINVEPKEPSNNVSDVQFLLFTRENPNEEQILFFNDSDSIAMSNFRADRSTKFLVHGYTDNGRTEWAMTAKDMFLIHEDCNVISVDWEALGGPSPFYVAAALNTKIVGYRVAELIQFMVDEFEAELSSFHPIGFSLGAQVVGHLGHKLEGRLDRITGLDPAGFMFHTVDNSERLSPEDAAFVDVIHSAGLWIGTDDVVGHVDFYPNSGMAPQPGCEDEDVGLSCSHHRAPDFFIESINSEVGFEAVKCGSWEDFVAGLCDEAVDRNMMGLPATPSPSGVYYLRTSNTSPYALP